MYLLLSLLTHLIYYYYKSFYKFFLVFFFIVWGAPQDKNLLIALLDHLKKQDKLPVVAFTLSRKRCDLNASLLTSVDLVTADEKARIHQFFQKCVSRLKGSDQKLPQVNSRRSIFDFFQFRETVFRIL